jgi:DeoR/GlpR family transcriptional regulator of sugar metabolism
MTVPAIAWRVALASSPNTERRVLLVYELSRGERTALSLARKLKVSKATIERDLAMVNGFGCLERSMRGKQRRVYRLKGAP